MSTIRSSRTLWRPPYSHPRFRRLCPTGTPWSRVQTAWPADLVTFWPFALVDGTSAGTGLVLCPATYHIALVPCRLTATGAWVTTAAPIVVPVSPDVFVAWEELSEVLSDWLTFLLQCWSPPERPTGLHQVLGLVRSPDRHLPLPPP